MNLTNFSITDFKIPGLYQNCTGKDYYSVECLNKLFCPQINHWLINTALVLVIVYILHLWVIDLVLKYINTIEGINLSDTDKRFWKYWLKDRLMDIMAIFIFLILVMYR